MVTGSDHPVPSVDRDEGEVGPAQDRASGQSDDLRDLEIRPFADYSEFRSWVDHLVSLYVRAYEGMEQYAYRGRRRIYKYIYWLYRGDPELFLVAWSRESRPVGFISAHRHWVDPDLGEVGNIHEMNVDPQFQGRGVGRRLFRTVLEKLCREHSRVMLWVGAGNQRAKQMYERLGFREVVRYDEWIKMARDCSPVSENS
ncbi:MAG: GNAT family N-acetyltransferase [candidate division KSB1 bacterium]|nr:GNAT family N-acetyltransferase [candidate division KSB1 bacterium]